MDSMTKARLMILQSIEFNTSKPVEIFLAETKKIKDQHKVNEKIESECPVCFESYYQENGMTTKNRRIVGKNCNHHICDICYRGLSVKQCVICRKQY